MKQAKSACRGGQADFSMVRCTLTGYAVRLTLRGVALHFGVEHLNAAVRRGFGVSLILQVGLAVAGSDEVAGRDVILLDQNPLDRIGATLRQALIIGLATL